MSRFLIALFVVAMFASVMPSPVEAGPLRNIAARVRRPFNGNGVPVARRARGGCANGSCSF